MIETMEHRRADTPVMSAAEAAAVWLERFADALEQGSADAVSGLLTPDATWRDFLAFEWDFTNRIDRDAVARGLVEGARRWEATGFVLNAEQQPAEKDFGIQVFFDFTTKDRIDRGYVVLAREGDGVAARTLHTQAEALSAHPEATGENRPQGKVYDLVPGRTRWADDRAREAAFDEDEPAVLVLGAGHNGLAVAARLGALDVPTLVIDRHARVGDQWRRRYSALALHSSVFGDHLPYMPLPPTWTAHTPKDKWADWLESYATLMDLNVWTSTEYLDGEYDEDESRWNIRVRRGDGSIRELHPRHFFVAGGMFGSPKIPQVEGLDAYEGEAIHSDAFQDGASFSGRRALVVGSGVSGHEIAHDLWEHGADVTMLQRSSTYVLTYESYHRHWNPLFSEHLEFPLEFTDQVLNASPFVRNVPVFKQMVKASAETDAELLAGLREAGFQLDWGPDGTGVLGAHQSGRDGYQIDIGASQLIANRSVHLKQGVELARIDGRTVTFSDGDTLDVDVIVFATGYHQFWGHIGPSLGRAAARIEGAYMRGEDGEYLNTWRRSAQPGLWFGAGFIRMARYYTKFSALLIKAIEEGLIPLDPTRPEEG